MVCGGSLLLPLGANLEWGYQQAIDNLQHDEVVLVENWETFERIDDLQVDISRVSSNPLIMWRGGSSNSTTSAAHRFLEGYGRPVWSTPDYDSAGLAIAARLPNLSGVLAPSDEILRALLGKFRLHDRFSSQLAGSVTTIECSPTLISNGFGSLFWVAKMRSPRKRCAGATISDVLQKSLACSQPGALLQTLGHYARCTEAAPHLPNEAMPQRCCGPISLARVKLRPA